MSIIPKILSIQKVVKHMKNNSKSLQYVIIILMSLVFLFIGNRIATANLATLNLTNEFEAVEAIVRQIIDVSTEHHQIGDDFSITNTDITFEAEISRGEHRNESVIAIQNLSSFIASGVTEVEVGDRIVIFYDNFNNVWHFVDYVRINAIWFLAIAFIALLVIFGGKKGFNSMVALGFTCMSIFAVFLPAILSGKNIYITSIIVCIFSIVSTLFIVAGINKKSISSILGCLGGVLVTGLLIVFMDIFLNLTGLVNQEAHLLLFLPTSEPLDLRAIIFASIIIGAVGAIMDVAMSISSSLWELKTKAADDENTLRSLFESGINIGKDMLGTMVNTLILAYIGSSLSIILLISVNANSLVDLLNMEMVIVEFLRALVGSFGIFFTIPLTSIICAALYSQDDSSLNSDV